MEYGVAAIRVLIVDDQESFRRVARAAVELSQGFEFAGEVKDGESSVDAVRALNPDLVLMDVHLSGIDGLEACRRIRSASTSTEPIVFLLSTYEADEFARHTVDCGADAYLPKAEFSPELLALTWASVTGNF